MNDVLFLREVEPSDADFKTFIESKKENQRCADDLSASINRHYSGYSLDTKSVIIEMLDNYIPERIAYILAVRVHDNDGFDKRISTSNERWGKELLAGIPDMYKNKDTSPIKYDLSSYLSCHNGLADIAMSEFRRVFPDIELLGSERPITASIAVKPYGPTFEDDNNTFDVDFIDEDNAFISFEVDLPTASTMYRLLQRVPDFDEFYPHESLNEFMVDRLTNQKIQQDEVLNRSYVRVFEDGSLELIELGHSIPLDESEKKALENVLNAFTKDKYRATLPQTVLSAINGTKPDELRIKGKAVNIKDEI